MALGKSPSKGRIDVKSTITDDILHIDCKNCECTPDPVTVSCMRCMTDCISNHGRAGRIRLRDEMDIEISGAATDILCNLASVDRSNHISPMERPRRHANCESSLKLVFSIAWDGFPDPHFNAARAKLDDLAVGKVICDACAQRARGAMDQSEFQMRELKKRALIESMKVRA